MAEFKEDLLSSVGKEKGDIADAVGMPDDQDLETLTRIVKRFEKTHPGLIKASLLAGRRDYELGIHRGKRTWTGKSTVSRDSNMVYAMELPTGLQMAIEKVFPTMFRSKRHFQWFKKHFMQLTIDG